MQPMTDLLCFIHSGMQLNYLFNRTLSYFFLIGGSSLVRSLVDFLWFCKSNMAESPLSILLQVESYESERTLRKIKRHPTSVAVDVGEPYPRGGKHSKFVTQEATNELSVTHMERLKLSSDESVSSKSSELADGSKICVQEATKRTESDRKFIAAPSNWYVVSVSSLQFPVSWLSCN